MIWILLSSESNENPVFYVQYAHARISSIIRNITVDEKEYDLRLLTDKTEIALMKKLADFAEITSQQKTTPIKDNKNMPYDLAISQFL